MCSSDGKAELLFQSSVSHDPSEIFLICWFGAKETSLIINVEHSCENWFFVFSGFCDE